MKPLTVYEANDGSRWNTEAQAAERDALLVAVEEAMQPLGKHDTSCVFANGGGYYQHTPAAYATARAALWEITRDRLKSWLDIQREKHGKTEADCSTAHPSRFLRMLDGVCGPVERAWSRICHIDDQYREWGQRYFVSRPNEANQVCLNGAKEN